MPVKLIDGRADVLEFIHLCCEIFGPPKRNRVKISIPEHGLEQVFELHDMPSPRVPAKKRLQYRTKSTSTRSRDHGK